MKRPANPMPELVRIAFYAHALRGTYDARPWYQRNGDLGWINHAKREVTKQKRVNQMLEDLKSGDLSMTMAWRP